MKTTRRASPLTTLPILLAVLCTAEAAADSASSSINISATVVENCTIATTGLSFGAYDPILANASDPLTGTGIVTVTCTTGTEASVMLGQGAYDKDSNPNDSARKMSADGSSGISYSLYSDPGRTVVWGGTAETCVSYIGIGISSQLTVYGSIAAGQQLPEGNYSSVLLATVMF